MMLESVIGITFIALTVLLVAASLGLLVPVLRDDYAVLYQGGVLHFSLSLLFFAAGYVVEDLAYYDIATGPAIIIGYSLLYVISGCLHLRAVWLFSRGFVVFEDRDVFETQTGGNGFETQMGEDRGFEDAD